MGNEDARVRHPHWRYMSTTTILAVYPGDRVESLERCHNSWLSAPIIWERVCKKYLDLAHVPLHDSQKLQRLWDAWQRPEIPEADRAVLLFTMERVFVKRIDFLRLAKDIRSIGLNGHWPRIAELLMSEPEIPAIGLWCTSVSDNPFLGAYNGETDEYGPVDWSATADLYAELDALKEDQNT